MIRYHFGQRARGATNKDLPPEGWPNFGLVHARRWRGRYRVAVLLACGAAAYGLVFHAPFPASPRRHVFSAPRRWHARQVDRLLGLPPRPEPAARD